MLLSPPTCGPWQRIHTPASVCGASPFWHAVQQRLYWADAPLRRVWRWHPASGHFEHWELAQEPGSIVPCRSGGVLLVLRDGIYHAANWQDTPLLVNRAPFDPSTTRFGTSVCDPWGRLWLATVSAPGSRDGLYCLHGRSKEHPALLNLDPTLSNLTGLACSPDGRNLYWGNASQPQVFTQELLQASQWPPGFGMCNRMAHWETGAPGGAVVDQQGRYWVTLPTAGRILCLNPDGVTLLDMAAPAPYPTDLCFGGSDMRTLYVTTGHAPRTPSDTSENSGHVFACPTDVAGIPMRHYDD